MRTGLISVALLAAVIAAVLWLVLDHGAEPGIGDTRRADAAVTGGTPGPAAAPAAAENANRPEQAPPAAASTPPTDLPAATTGAISGHVRFVGAEPAPVVGAKIVVLDQASGICKQVSTDREGAYRIADLAPARWKIRVMPPGYPRLVDASLQVSVGEDTVRDFEVPRGTVLSGRVVDDLTGEGIAGAVLTFHRDVGHQVRTDDEGNYRALGVTPVMVFNVIVTADGYNKHTERPVLDHPLPAATSLDIRLRPLARVSGVVLDPAGATVAGARVWFQTWLKRDGAGGGAVTDAHGRFSLGVPTMWEWQRQRAAVFAHREGFAYGMIDETFHMDGEHVENLVIRLRPAGVIAGRVTSAAPIDQATAHCWTTDEAARRKGRDSFQAAVGSNGEFALRDLPAGSYQLQVRAANAVTSIHEVAVAGGATTNLQLELAANQGVIRGLVTDEAGNPIPAARITVLRHPHPYGTPKPRAVVTSTDAEGRFRAEQLEDLAYWVTCRGEGKHGVRPGADELRLVLPRRDTASVILGGRVVDENGAPVARCSIGVYEDLDGRLKEVASRCGRETALKDGRFQVVIRSEPRSRRLLLGAVTGRRCSARRAVVVSPGLPVQPVTLVMAKGAVIRGRVQDANGAPVSGARVVLRGTALGEEDVADTTISGRFTFSRGQPAGSYRIRVRHPLWNYQERSLVVRQGEDANLEFVLGAPDAEVNLLVQSPDGHPIAGARVWPRWRAPRSERLAFEAAKQRDPKITWHEYQRRFTTTDDDGRWSRRNLPAGHGGVYIQAEGFESREVKVTLGAGEKRTLKVVLQSR